MLSETYVTKYCPFDWLDEVVPVLVEDPAEIVVAVSPTGWMMIADKEELDEEEASCRCQIEPGQIVQFGAHRNYGICEIVIRLDGTYAAGPYPVDATHFQLVEGDELDMHDSMEELIRAGNPEDFNRATPLEPGTYGVYIWHWSDPIPFRFEVEDGKPKFVRCAGVS